MTILILGGTAEARALAADLVQSGTDVVSSLAGRVSRPALPVGRCRVGGFGGVTGLQTYLRTERVRAVVDATHPFAATISANAAAATAGLGIALLRLERPSWREHPHAGGWTWVPDAAAVLDLEARRPFVTTGRQGLGTFLPWADRDVLVRVVEPPDIVVPKRWTVLRSRGPYDYPSERLIMVEHRVDALVTKDSGGRHTDAKLAVAHDLAVPVVVIERPVRPMGGDTVRTVAEAVAWCRAYGV